MGDYFKPWRRKLGVVTLVFALVFMAGWVRSNVVRERFSFARGTQRSHSIFSENGRLQWRSWQSPSRETIGESHFFSWITFGISGFSDIDYKVGSKQGWQGFGFESGASKHPGLDGEHETVVRFWVISYWSLVIPLTLLSAFLFISKPKTSPPKKFPEPTSIEGT